MSERLIPPLLNDRYRIERLIGRGGMATVHLARDLRHGRPVAVKVLEPELAQSLAGERFLREIAVAAGLTHPNILPLFDSGIADGRPFYVMPYVEGETLRTRLERERQLPVDEALRLTCEVASALDHAHRHGVVHRDVKPENILLEDGRPIVADFGIAHALGSAGGERLTSTGHVIGTPAYMSPEQGAGDPAIDGRSDVYSLACVLYEALAGEPPFTGSSAQSIIAKRIGGAPPRVRVVRPAVPEPVEQALLRALDRTPADRFPSARAFADALAACDLAQPRSLARMTRRRSLAGAGLAAAVVSAAWLYGGRSVPPAASPAPPAAVTVAILPFTNQSANPAPDYLAAGLTDAVIADISRVPGIRVVSRTSAMRYASGMGSGGGAAMPSAGMAGGMSLMQPAGRQAVARPAASAGTGGMGGMGEPKPLSAIARELRATLLLQGSLGQEGDSVRLTAALIRAPALEQVWRRSYTRHMRDLLALQQELVADVVAAAEPTPEPRPARAGNARSYAPGAHQAYLKGAYFQSHWKLGQAVESFELAARLDPTHAPAQAGLARAYYFLAFFGQAPPSVALAGMRRAATAALAADSLLAEAHGQLALVKMLQDWDWSGAERAFRRALELSPADAQIRHDYAHFLLGQGRQPESVEQTRHAVALDPVNPMLISCLGWHALFDGRYGDAERQATEANMMMPDAWPLVILGWSRLGQRRPDSALAAFRSAHQREGSAFTLAALGHALAVTGHDVEARRAIRTLLARREREYVSAYDVATVYAGLGETDQAFRWLRRAAEERSTFVVHVGWDTRFDRIRSDPRFAELLTQQLRFPAPQFASLTAEERRKL